MRTICLAATIATACLLGSALCPVGAFGQDTCKATAWQHYDRALPLLDNNQQGKGIEELKAAIAADPECVEAQLRLLGFQVGKENLELPYELYVKSHPDSAVFHYLLGRAYAMVPGRTVDARQENRKALTIDPRLAWALKEEARIAGREGNREEALKLAREAAQSSGKSVELNTDLAELFYQFQDYKAAALQIDRVAAVDPVYFPAYPVKWHTLIAAQSGSNDAKHAIQADALRLEKQSGQTIKTLGILKSGYTLAGDEEGAKRVSVRVAKIISAYEQARPHKRFSSLNPPTLSGDADGIFQSDLKIEDLHRKIAALKNLEPDIRDSVDLAEVFLPTLLSFQLSADDVAAAMLTIKEMKADGSLPLTIARAHLDVAGLLSHKHEYPDAISQLTTAIDLLKVSATGSKRPEYGTYATLANTLQLKGEYQLQEGKVTEAIEALKESAQLRTEQPREAREMSPMNELSALLGRAYSTAGKKQDALKYLTDAYSRLTQKMDTDKAHASADPQESAIILRALPEEEALLNSYKQEMVSVYTPQPGASSLDEYFAHAVLTYKRDLVLVAMAATKADKPGPDFTLPLVDGGKLRLSSLRGKVVLLNFWATWCGPCREEYPYLQQIDEAYRDKGFVVLMVSIDEDAFVVKPFVDKAHFKTKVLLTDGFIQSAYGVTNVPHTIILDKQGIARVHEVGFDPSMPGIYRAVVDTLLEEKTP